MSQQDSNAAAAPTEGATTSRMPGRPKGDLPPAVPGFVGGKSKSLGEIDHEAAKRKSQSPQRHVPKVTLADGKTPAVDLKVMDRGGYLGTIVETFQTHSRILYESGARRVVANGLLNAVARSRGQKPAVAGTKRV